MANKCIRFCLKLDKMHPISEEDFRLINWLPTSKRVDQCINTITFKFVNNTCPYYLKEIFEFAKHCRKIQDIHLQNLKSLFARQTSGRNPAIIHLDEDVLKTS